MNIKEIIKDLDPITLLEFKNYLLDNLTSLLGVKNSNAKIISQGKQKENVCSNCGCKIYKNGKTKNGIQKYICSGCKKTSSATTDTVVYHSKIAFDIWKNVIDNLLDGFSLRRIAQENDISLATSFSLRHKVLLSLKTYTQKVELKGEAQADAKYFSINLKGTKPKNMPRYSKKRTSTQASYRGISHHKICVISAIDEHDNMVLKIGGLGRETTEMLEKELGKHIINVKQLTSDGASAYQTFCANHNITLIQIPSGSHSNGVNNIAEINCVHSHLETWIHKFRGVSTRHLQEYLNWFNYIFTLKKRFDLKHIKLGSYKSIIPNKNYIKANNIFKIKMPIDLNAAYAEYNYQS